MKTYSIRPNKDADAWHLKLDDAVPEKEYDKKDEAVEAGTKVAEQNKPSKLVIYNHLNEVIDEKIYK
ncbi:DUF2188 domain-containing protein [Bacillus shivajii]|uniref:DUF2188 domain-containing protein n=1 Tax=Bacillus shivajii TaxID=1983719 RepID=UPI001CFAD622|nr:DUF2188 domain-containing protein [Bacillus shivajii]UCZ54144.1 DUF2188 domain-containing protein [Bacillus shivajii]